MTHTKAPGSTRSRRRWALRCVALPSLLVLIALAGCGGGDDDKADTSATTTTAAPATTTTAADTTTTGGGATTTAPPGGSTAVTIKDFAFSPTPLKIKVNDTVTFTNQDPATHTATASPGDTDMFDSQNLATGKSYTHTFSQAGTFKYICSIHTQMQGEIDVS